MLDIVFLGLDEPVQKRQLIDGLEYYASVGGGAAITSIGLCRLGYEVTLLTSLGTDVFGDFLLNELTAEGVQVVPDRISEVSCLSVEQSFSKNRATLVGGKAPLSPEVLSIGLEHARFSHAHFVKPDADCANLIEQASRHGISVSVDMPVATSPDLEIWRRIAAHVDYVTPSSEEISDGETPENAAKKLGSECRGWGIVTLGAEGAVASDGTSSVTSQAIRVDEIDSTGAGDGFCAGLIMALLDDDRSIETLLATGNVVGGLNVAGVGGIDALPNRETVERVIGEQK